MRLSRALPAEKTFRNGRFSKDLIRCRENLGFGVTDFSNIQKHM